MAFLFSSSHLPASRVRRHALEDEDDNENREALPRSGGVRASSHLEGRMPEPETARSAGGSPAPRSSGAGIDWMARLKELAEQQPQRRRADSAAPDSGPRRADEEHEPDAEPDHDADEAPGGEHEEAPEHEGHEEPKNTSSWYHPPESGSYHPDPGFNVRPEDIGHVSSDPGFNIRSEDIGTASPDTGFYQHLSEIKGEGKPAVQAGRAPSSSPDWRERQSDRGRGQRGVGPNVPAGSIAARPSVATSSRLFEMRSAPDAYSRQQQQARGAGGSTAQQRLQGAPQAIAAQQQVPGANPPTQTPGGKPAVQPQATAQAQSPATGPSQNAPAVAQAPTGGPAIEKAQPPQFQVNEADDHTPFDLYDHETGRLIQKGVKFGDYARSVINEELENSPTATLALNQAWKLSKKNVVIHSATTNAQPYIGLDGTIHIYVNPKTLKPGTLAHEITHILQDWHRTMAMRSGKRLTEKDRTAYLAAAKREVEAVSKGVTVENGDPNEERENEAMRIGNIAMAEVKAAKIKRQLEALRTSNADSDKREYNRLIQNPAEIARMFWSEMRPPDKRIPPREGTIHQNNDYRMPESTIYGGYDFRHVLNTLGYGVTYDILMNKTPKRDEYKPGPNQKFR